MRDTGEVTEFSDLQTSRRNAAAKRAWKKEPSKKEKRVKEEERSKGPERKQEAVGTNRHRFRREDEQRKARKKKVLAEEGETK